MKLSELIETLQEFAEFADYDMEVFLAIQPNYPLELSLACVTQVDDTVYIAAGETTHRDTPYAPSEAWDGGVVNLLAEPEYF